jgi:hypothetical protein
MAALMGVEQENVSRLERRADLLLSTLSSYVAAMGGTLRLVAEFPDRRPVAIALADIAGTATLKPVRRGRAVGRLLARQVALGPTPEVGEDERPVRCRRYSKLAGVRSADAWAGMSEVSSRMFVTIGSPFGT